MGCSCLRETEEIITNQESRTKIKENCQEEYFSYLYFIFTLKGYFNTGQYKENNSRNEINNNHNNIITKKKFYLIPLNWFEDWEKRIKNILMKNEYRIFKAKFKYKNYENKTKFFFKLMSEENWEKISKNKEYNLNDNFKTEIGIICNNLIIFQYKSDLEEKNNCIEIFFFEKDDDLFLTNLLFSFEKCNDAKSERNNFLKILKLSPIDEILGNMHYDQSQPEFIEERKKIIIYNKTRIVTEEIKRFRKKQYELLIESNNNKEKEDTENENINPNIIINKEPSLVNYNQISIKLNHENNRNESQAISRASTIMNANHQNLMSIYSNNNNNLTNKVKIRRKEDIFMEDYNIEENKNFKEIKLNDKLLLNNKVRPISKIIRGDNSDRNFNELEITEIVENKINESFLISVIYCFFNIYNLRDFIHSSIDNINIDLTRFYPIFANIMNFIYDKICSENNSFDLNKIKNIKYNLIKNCDDYNFQKFSEIIKNITGKNLISKIINLLHTDINQKYKEYSPKEIIKNDKETKYNEFIDNIKSIHCSIFFDLFFGIKKVTKICNNCKKELEIYKLFNVFNISPEDISDEFLKNENNNEQEEINISIEKYLSHSLNKIKDNQGMFKCPFCNNNSSFNKIKNICKYPDYTIFYLDNECKNKFKINLDENLYILNNSYELIGIITKINNDEENKFICYCQNIINKMWFKYDDENINNIDINEEKKNILYPMALFYQKIK